MIINKFWDYDDITPLFRNDLLAYPPLVILAVSLLVLVAQSSFKKRIQLTHESRLDLKSRHFDLVNLPETLIDGSPHGHTVRINKSGWDKARVYFEYFLIILNLLASICLFFVTQLQLEFSFNISVILLSFWAYNFILVTVRVLNINRLNFDFPNLWVHSTSIYFFNIFANILLFRSALIRKPEIPTSVFIFYIFEAIVAFILLVLNFTAKVGDKPSEIYISDGIPSPENITSVISFITYSWLDPIVWLASKQPLKVTDIWGLRKDDYALDILKSFEAFKSARSFPIRLFFHFKFLFGLQSFFAILESFIIFVPTILLKKILEYVEDPISNPASLAWTFVVLMPIFKVIDSIASGCSLFLGRRVCLRMKAIIIGEVYAKALRRRITVADVEGDKEDEEDKDKKDVKKDDKKDGEDDSTTKKTAELGAIINLMSVDAFKVSEICGYLHFFVASIIMIFICIGLLYNLLGWSAIVGSIGIVALLPLNYKLATFQAEIQKLMLGITDKRIQKLNETFNAIRIIKFFAWENKFYDSVMKVRSEEINYLKKRTYAWAVGAFLWFISPTLVTLVSFYCYTVVEGKVLTAPIAFTSLSLFTLLRNPLDQLSEMTAFVIQSKVSLDRVDDFLNEEETTKYDQLDNERGPNSPEIGFENASFSWNSKADVDFKLRDIDVAFKVGKLNVIIGPTGSGKTSLLLALLGEMELSSGNVFLPGIIPRDELIIDPTTGLTDSVAYCSQAPWLLNDTIRNNIIFVAPYNEERYNAVIHACGLTRDLEILSAGDATEIGEKGITLSGGQKQRVSLARALYSNSKQVLLDDCLSAVDSHTALWIYENCVTGDLMTGRTCILVSHNVALTASGAAWIVVMDNGKIKSQGTPEALLETGDLGDDDLVKSSVLNSNNASSTNLKNLGESATESNKKAAAIEQKLKDLSKPDEDVNKHDGKLIEDESKAEGVVGLSVYTTYASYFGGYGMWSVILFFFVCSQIIYMFQSFWLRKWSNSSEAASGISYTMSSFATVFDVSKLQGVPYVSTAINLVKQNVDAVETFKKDNGTLYYIAIYGIIGVIYAIVACIRIVLTFIVGIDASNTIFEDILNRILRAKLRFFDKTPIGRIMNRFSKDVEAVDQELTPFAEGAFMCLVQCISTLVLITIITPKFLVVAFVISFLYYLVGYFYITLSRELKRFESVTKSPIHQHFSESLNGVATIRAYGIESRFMRQNIEAIDKNNAPFFYLWVANRWLSFRIDAVGSLVMFFAGSFVLLSIGKIDAGLAGLSLSYAIAFSESALWIVRFYANIEMNMNSFERLQEYLEVEQEAPYDIPETEPPASWPETGRINVKDLSLRYAPELPRVIRNVTFDVEPNHKVGIVGRTGAGKSTIITAFFRFLDADSGSIEIDGVDISTIGLRNLRQAITIIPQDPTLFSGTIRSNLDPFTQYSDESMFEALKRVNLIGPTEMLTSENPVDLIASANDNENQNKFLNLDSTIAEGGGNLSQGERQLVCLARSLLKNPKIILLDEATSSIDYKSDAMIQQTIRQEFGNSTILTIAHRLRTIIDYDKILVMDAGQVVEYDNPYVLIADKSTVFYSMCENSGELDTLTKVAKEAYVKKKNQIQN